MTSLCPEILHFQRERKVVVSGQFINEEMKLKETKSLAYSHTASAVKTVSPRLCADLSQPAASSSEKVGGQH